MISKLVNNRNRLTWLTLVGLVLIGWFIRTWQLQLYPPGLYLDEASIYVNAKALKVTGADEHSAVWPYWFKAFGEYKLPVYIYLVWVNLHLLTSPELVVRLPSVIAGSLSIGLIYVIYRQLWPKQKQFYGLVAAAIFAILPWSVHLSRGGFEANLGLLLNLLIVACFGWAQKQPYFYLLISVLAGLSMSTYNANRLFTPLLLLLFVWYYQVDPRKWSKRVWVWFGSVSLVIATVLLSTQFSSQAYIRAEQTLIRGRSIWETNQMLIENFARHLDPYFLFFRGDQIGRHATRKHGMLFISLLPLILLGIAKLKTQKRKLGLICVWLIISILPAAITIPSPHGLRSLNSLPIWIFLSSLGLSYLFRQLNNRALKVSLILVLSLGLLYEFGWYGLDYRFRYSQAQELDWGAGYQRALNQAKELVRDGEKIIITADIPVEYLLVSDLISAPELQVYNQSDNQEKIFDRVEFITPTNPLAGKQGLVIAPSHDQPDSQTASQVVRYNSGDVAYWLWRLDATN